MNILHIETSTNVCSVSLSISGNLVYKISNSEGLNHAELLSQFVQNAMELLKPKGYKLDAVSVSIGPGSYTGLRIGLSTAKGLCYGYDAKLITIETLKILAVAALGKIEVEESVLLCPMLDARRMEVYTALYDRELNEKMTIQPMVVDSQSFSKILNEHKICFFGNGATKCKDVIVHPNAYFLEHIEPLAENMVSLAEAKLRNNQIADIAYSEPFYLKEFQATTPKKLI